MAGHDNRDRIAPVGRAHSAHGLAVINGGCDVTQAVAGACPADGGSQYSSLMRVDVSNVADTGETPTLRRCSLATNLVPKKIHIRIARSSYLPPLYNHIAQRAHDKQQHKSA